MKKLPFVVALIAAGIFLTGCIVASVYPFYFPKDVVFEPALLGSWCSFEPDKNTVETNECIRFEALGKDGYLLQMISETETNWLETHLFQMKKQKFLDQKLYATNQFAGRGFIAEHNLCKVSWESNTLTFAWLSQEWLDKLLEKNPQAVRYMVVHDNPNDEKGRNVLTADTKELQKFVLKYSTDTNAFFEVKYRKVME